MSDTDAARVASLLTRLDHLAKQQAEAAGGTVFKFRLLTAADTVYAQAATEIRRLTAALSAAEERVAVAERDAAEARRIRRWNITADGDALLICQGEHEKHEDCRPERWVCADAAESKAATLAARVEALEGALQYVASQEPSDATTVDVLAEYRHRRRRAIAALADQATPTTPDARLVAVVRAAHKLADAVHMDAGAARETGLLANDVDDAFAALPPEMKP